MSFVYRGLSATLERHIVTGREVLHHIQRLLQQNPRIAVITDRPTQSGDEIVLDYAGFCGGEQFAGGTAQNQTLVLGSGTFIPGFEEQLLDKVTGEKVTVKVTFPENYRAKELAGKKAEFHCVIHEIRVRTPYEMDDTFAKEVGGCQTLKEMEQKVRESLQAYTDQRGEMDLQDRLLRQAADTLDFTPTEDQVLRELDTQMENLTAQLTRQGLDLPMYCRFLNTTEEKLREDARQTAVESVRLQAAVEQIASLENLEPTQEEMGQALAVVCRQNNMTMEQLKSCYDARLEQAVIKSVVTGKVMKLIRDNARVEEREEAPNQR